jgi:ACT domain-containing protein
MTNLELVTKQDLEHLCQLMLEIKEILLKEKPEQKEVLTENEAQKFLGLSRSTLSKYRKEGVIPFSQRHRKIWYRLRDLQAYIAENSSKYSKS